MIRQKVCPVNLPVEGGDLKHAPLGVGGRADEIPRPVTLNPTF